jgi:hypothetical protein
MKLSDTGQPISLKQAETYVEAYKPIKDALRNKILKKIDDNDRKDLKVKDSEIFHLSDTNAFIFDADLVTRFFYGDNPAQYLMVFLAADKSEPTVVVAGVNQHPKDPNVLVSLKMENPATQHPKKRVDAIFPGPNKDNQSDLYIKLK